MPRTSLNALNWHRPTACKLPMKRMTLAALILSWSAGLLLHGRPTAWAQERPAIHLALLHRSMNPSAAMMLLAQAGASEVEASETAASSHSNPREVDYRFSTEPATLEQWEARCSGPKQAWLRDYARWHLANRHAPGTKYLVHVCGSEAHLKCQGLGEQASLAV